MKIKVTKIASHRNGISGEPFYVCLFTVGNHNMMATVFGDIGYCAVLDLDLTAKGNIEFAMGNSWRGDYYEKDLRQAIAEWKEAQWFSP